ncbi:MAG TPA: alpha/beta hydrolase [Blastocatellia bacterium]|nr:alpha/beta hydrolase [Blastocatellia bacterium]
MGQSTIEASSHPAGKKRPRRWLKWLRRVIVVLVLLAVVLVFGVAPIFLARLITHARTRPNDQTLQILAQTPATYGVEYQTISFRTSDGINISGWYLPSHGKAVTIIYSHGLFRSRREVLERACQLWKLGYGALLYDARNHGESGHSLTTVGYDERKDVEAAVSYLVDTVHTTDRIALLGVSMGAAADLLAAAETPNVAAVISDSSFLSFDDTVVHHLKLFFHLPAFPLAYELEFLIASDGKFEASKLSPVDAVKAMGSRPILFIGGAHDPRMPPAVAERLYKASSSPESSILIVDGPGSERHGHSFFVNPALYVETVSRFLDRVLPATPANITPVTMAPIKAPINMMPVMRESGSSAGSKSGSE